MGNPDLSADGPERNDPPRGLVIFPAENPASVSRLGRQRDRAERRGRRRDWWVMVAALVLAAVIVSLALIAR